MCNRSKLGLHIFFHAYFLFWLIKKIIIDVIVFLQKMPITFIKNNGTPVININRKEQLKDWICTIQIQNGRVTLNES
jgi:hypothetical protein